MKDQHCVRVSAVTEVTSGILFSLAAIDLWQLLWPSAETARFFAGHLQIYMNEQIFFQTLLQIEWVLRICAGAIVIFLLRFYLSFLVFDLDNSYCTLYMKRWWRGGRIAEWLMRCSIVTWVLLGVQSDLRIADFLETEPALVPQIPPGFPDLASAPLEYSKAFTFLFILFSLMAIWLIIMFSRKENRTPEFWSRFVYTPLLGLPLSFVGAFLFDDPTRIIRYGPIVSIFGLLTAVFAYRELHSSYLLLRRHLHTVTRFAAKGAVGKGCYCYDQA